LICRIGGVSPATDRIDVEPQPLRLLDDACSFTVASTALPIIRTIQVAGLIGMVSNAKELGGN
jgi:hypothetical protein